jgi:hypothetical protein
MLLFLAAVRCWNAMDDGLQLSDKVVEEGNGPDGSRCGSSSDSMDEVTENDQLNENVFDSDAIRQYYDTVPASLGGDDVVNYSPPDEVVESSSSLGFAHHGGQCHELPTECIVDVLGAQAPEPPFQCGDREGWLEEGIQGAQTNPQGRDEFPPLLPEGPLRDKLIQVQDVDPAVIPKLNYYPRLWDWDQGQDSKLLAQVGKLGQNGGEGFSTNVPIQPRSPNHESEDSAEIPTAPVPAPRKKRNKKNRTKKRGGSKSTNVPIQPRSTKQEGKDSTDIPTAPDPNPAKKRNQKRPPKYNKEDALDFPRRLLVRIENRALAQALRESKRRRGKTDATKRGRYKCNLCGYKLLGDSITADDEHPCPFVRIPRKLLEDLMDHIPDFPKDYKTILELLKDKDRVERELEEELQRLKFLFNRNEGRSPNGIELKRLKIQARIDRKEGRPVEVKKLRYANQKIVDSISDAAADENSGGEDDDDRKVGPVSARNDEEVSEPRTAELEEPEVAPPLFASMPSAAEGGGAADEADSDSSEDKVRSPCGCSH